MKNKTSKIGLLFVFTICSFTAVAQNELPSENGNYHSSLELQEMFLEGILLIAFFINLIFYRTIKDKTHLYFALFLLFLAISRSGTTLGSFLHWQYPDIWKYLFYLILSWAFTIFFLIKFVSQFFGLKDTFPLWHKVLLVFGLLFGGMTFLFQFISNGFPSTPGSVISLVWSAMLSVICINILIIFFKYFPKHKTYAKLIIFGGTPLMLVWGLYALIMQYVIYSTYTNADFLKLPWWFFAERSIEIVSIAWFVLFFLWTLILRFENLRKENTQRSIDYERLEKQKEIERSQLVERLNIELEQTVDERTAELKQSLYELKTTQKQLIQSEKMASLGELTAGIAHEIQNPLNFVNNFSEVNKELLIEMNAEIEKGNTEEVKAIAKDIFDNEEKINHHGKRADAIVKGMLQHSRASSGKKEPTDINALADEYLRLSYHGLRAKDKDFNADFKTDFDGSIGSIEVVPQDIGRVLLNLYTNAFYSVAEKKKFQADGYEPTVSVFTKKENGKVFIKVKDNGMGIPQKVLDKIFQPFYTTKPTGQGTGLGLSLSYDILKAHGGDIKVETKEGEFAEFVIILKINST
jgi:signal transduction histidine kinase